jgi:hypothetical protein
MSSFDPMKRRETLTYIPSWQHQVTAFFMILPLLAVVWLAGDRVGLLRNLLVGGAAVICAVAAIVSFLEARRSSLILTDRELHLRSLFRATTVSFSEVTVVALEDGKLSVKLATGRWLHMPEWLDSSQKRSARAQIKRRVSACTQAPVPEQALAPVQSLGPEGGQLDFRAAGRDGYLVVHDPHALPDGFPVDPDTETDQPNPPPAEAIAELADHGLAMVIKMPEEWDCEASLRVFVDQEPAALLKERSSSHRGVTGARLSVPSGNLIACGAEYMEVSGLHRRQSLAERAEIRSGDYRLEINDLFEWKIAHVDQYTREHTSWLTRAVSRLAILVAIGGCLLIAANVVAMPGLIIFGLKGHDAFALRLGVVLGVTDLIVIGGMGLFAFLSERFPALDLLGKASRVQEEFENENPDVVAVLKRLTEPDSSLPVAPSLLRIEE